MAKKTWAKGRKDPTCLVRLDPDVYQVSKEEAERRKVTHREYVSECVRTRLLIMGKKV